MAYGLVFGAATSDRVVCGSAAALDDLQEFTTLTWFRATSLTASRTLISKCNTGASVGWLFCVQTTGGQMLLLVQRATSDLTYVTNPTPAPVVVDTWVCVASTVSISGNVGHIYYGTLTSAMVEATYSTSTGGSGASVSDAAENLVLGNRGSSSPVLATQGTIGVTAIYNRVLSSTEIEQWRLRPSRSIGSGCLGYWILGNEGSVGTQVDLSGNGNDGTVTGCTASSQQLPLALHGHLAGLAGASRNLVGQGLIG